ncbi:STAS domain-containing protein [Amycolatopsis sp., V23-08]|uniref:STAS domain-containing protein n=1 Tax=Amycolatopsis heterodermiae TaxID=3110235 RepID=A0ABU5RB92_9PSEU|nr:STAS domain-containing protein [Amycolatopsis sp., V23-08]MEA5363517.1 STAS domain-containing protein [Amycolatopsis sp., V23-08]
MTTALSLVLQERPDGTRLLAASGEIDISNAADLAKALEGALEGAPEGSNGRVTLDLTAVDYLDSAGIAVLFDHADHLELAATPLLMPVLTVSGLGDLAPIRESD